MFKVTRSCNNIAHTRMHSAFACLLALLLAACQNAATPAPSLPPAPTPLTFVPLDVLLKSNAAPPPGDVTTGGYLVVDSAGAALVDGLSFAKVLPITSVVRFSLCERKTNNKKKEKYRCENHI